MASTLDVIAKAAEPRAVNLDAKQVEALHRLFRQCSHGYVLNALAEAIRANPTGPWSHSLREFEAAWKALQVRE